MNEQLMNGMNQISPCCCASSTGTFTIIIIVTILPAGTLVPGIHTWYVCIK